ncbi:hypothetical protein NM680_09815 [Paracoccus sp. PS-1]|uniref:hypothetical protein n=1 Tax=unclassified Paracoccus (in: a-proteobacteria) TaxID=2688777 RepID=UPI0004B7B644|nr:MULTISPECIES: hypothetical protein [unclassified Paracoccus (in: a-proteobacteria)]MDQ7262091.1 hypothetical protein [Paracoccus sp. PS1]RQP05935.1 MAG: hypothetical protein D1H97_10340 [Paracoccus sp. BP8]UFM67104.1 hypothetical protein LOS78_21570 [Paracoccus sp. MA]
MAKYNAPVQGKIGQIIDVIVLLIMAIGALYIPLWLGLAGSAKNPQTLENPTWEALAQNPAMVEQWHKLGYSDPSLAAEMITARFDYSFSIGALLAMIVVVVGYYAILLRFSENEYRDVIAEKFGE